MIISTIFHVLINGFIACPKCILSCDIVDDQSPGRSYVIFPGSHAIKSHNIVVAERSCDRSHAGSCDRFPQSSGLWVTWLLLGLGGVSFACLSIPSLGSPCTCKACMRIPSLRHCQAWNSATSSLACVNSPAGIHELLASV